jgi:hypothetical protein
MLEYVIDNIFTMVGGRVFLQTICILLFLYSYGADFIQGFLKENEKKLARSFNFTFRYIADVLALNTSTFGNFVDRIYPIMSLK